MGNIYAVCDMQGRVIATGYVDAANFNVSIAHPGIYLVRIGMEMQTVRIK